jgi:hypothetical protein
VSRGGRGPFPDYARSHVFECPSGHRFECGDAQHHVDPVTLVCPECRFAGVEAAVVVHCPPGCRVRAALART